MFVRSYRFHVSHQYTLHVIIISGKTTHCRCLVHNGVLAFFVKVSFKEATLSKIRSGNDKFVCSFVVSEIE